MNTVIDDVSYLVSVCTVRCAPILPGVGGWGPPPVPTSNLAQKKVVHGFWHVCLSCLCLVVGGVFLHVFYTRMVLAYPCYRGELSICV